MEQLKIAHRQGHSGGQQQRVAVARAIVGKPKLNLADEPTGNLDSSNGEEIMRILTGLHEQGSTIVFVTHSEACAECSQRIIHGCRLSAKMRAQEFPCFSASSEAE
jgi:putative ABC transport system ATP-binding protein